MMDFDILTPEEKIQYGTWIYTMLEGWKDPDWWDKHRELAEATGHVLTVNIKHFDEEPIIGG